MAQVLVIGFVPEKVLSQLQGQHNRLGAVLLARLKGITKPRKRRQLLRESGLPTKPEIVVTHYESLAMYGPITAQDVRNIFPSALHYTVNSRGELMLEE